MSEAEMLSVDGEERFRQAVNAAAKSGPKHRASAKRRKARASSEAPKPPRTKT
jgi:hypothetical protein